jgi:hypothetical protein
VDLLQTLYVGTLPAPGAAAVLAAVASLTACGARTEGGDPGTGDSSVESPSATTTPAAPMAGDSMGAMAGTDTTGGAAGAGANQQDTLVKVDGTRRM